MILRLCISHAMVLSVKEKWKIEREFNRRDKENVALIHMISTTDIISNINQWLESFQVAIYVQSYARISIIQKIKQVPTTG